MVRFWRIPNSTIDRINPWFAAFVIGSPPVLGSVTSVLIIGTMLLCAARIASGELKFAREPNVKAIALVFALWFCVQALSGVIHYQPHTTLLEIFRNTPFLGLLFLFSGFAVSNPARLALPTESGIIVGAFAALIYALYQYLNGMVRVEGLTGNPGPFAAMSLLLYGYCVILVARNRGKIQLIALLAAAAATICVILSGMRGAWLGLILLPIAVFAIYRADLRRLINLKTAFALGTVLILAASVTYPVIAERFEILFLEWQMVGKSNLLGTSVGDRIAAWSAGWALMTKAPLLGYGLDQGPALMGRWTFDAYGVSHGLSHFHNIVIDTGVRTGLLGIIMLLAMVATPLILAVKTPKNEFGKFGYAALTILMLTYLIVGATGRMLGHDIMDTVFIFAASYWCVFIFGTEIADSQKSKLNQTMM